ncbi:g6920 [Coccomyxa elongata]
MADGSPALFSGIPLWADILLSAGCVCISAYFAGTTLGVLSLDKIGLQIIAKASDDEKERSHAKAILPVRERGNWLLCTLLIGNTIANSFLSILLAGYTSGILGLVLSTVLIVIFAEIIPQAFCSRNGLLFGAKTIWIIRVCMVLLAPVAWPLSFILDKILGHEVGNIYTRSELKHLIQIHVENPVHQEESGLTIEDHQLLSGALDYKDKRVKDVMTPMHKVYMIEAGVRLNFEHMLEIYKSGYTRIPVYDKDPQNIIGILYTKDLILVDPDDELEIRTLVTFQGKDTIQYILDITPLNEVFKLFKTNRTHMMLACALDNPAQVPGNILSVRSQQNFLAKGAKHMTGVITLEDVLEEVIQDEIIDETDNFESNEHSVPVVRRPGRDRPDVSAYLALFEHKIRDQNKLSPAEVQAVSAFLLTAVPEFAIFASVDTVLKSLVRQAEMIDTEGSDSDEDGMGDAHSRPDPTSLSGNEQLLYTRGVPSKHFTLVLQGRVDVHAGEERFLSELGPWSVLGQKALGVDEYIPDFDARATGGCRMLRIHADAYRLALRMGKTDQIVGVRAMRQLTQALDYKPQQVRSNALQPSVSLSPRNAALPPPSGAPGASRGSTNGRRTGDAPAVGGPVATGSK